MPSAHRFHPVNRTLDRKIQARDTGAASRLSGGRAAWFTGVSLATLLVAGSTAEARPLGAGLASQSAPSIASDAAQQAAQQAAAMAKQSQASMARAVQALQAMQAAQRSARGLAASSPGSVPSGLTTGGLVPDSGLAAPGVANPVTTWTGANTPTQTTSGGQTVVNINQTQPRALLNWQTFNVSSTTTVNFNQQGNTDWSALNRIAAGIAPSQILGHIKADGAVYLINQNGIIFGGTSQINVHTLVASTLDTDPTGYLNNGLFASQLPTTVASQLKVNTGAVFSQGGSGTVTVQPGAVIDTTGNLNATGDGGYVALLGAGVTNAGSIITQNGQIILAAEATAGNTISLITPPSNLVGVKTAMQVVAVGGAVTNAGLLFSGDGAVILAGNAISQLGVVAATTSTTRTASILLDTSASTTGSGNIVLGPDSLTSILPDETSNTLPTATVNSTTSLNGASNAAYFQTVLQPTITINAAGNVDVGAGAFIKAPSAALTINAGVSSGAGTVLLEPGSTIDLSGLTGVTLPMSINEVTIKITPAEVADDPLAQGLIGETVTIDARKGSPILNAAGFIGLIPESIDQILTVGGTFTSSAKNFIQQGGAGINVSGGYVQYTGGMMSTSRLLSADGHLVDIGSADPNVQYLGVVTGFTIAHSHWSTLQSNVAEIFAPFGGAAHFEQGYVSGQNAGAISVTARVPIISAADITAGFVAGDRQRALAGSSNLAQSDQMPVGASLSINFVTQGAPSVVLEPRADAGADPYGLIAGNFSFANASNWTPVYANGVLPIFTDALSGVGFSGITILGAQQVNMPADASLSVRPGGSITLDGVATIDGVLSAPAGKISLTGFTYPGNAGPVAPPTPAVVIGPQAVLDVHGLWVNDTGLPSGQVQGPAFVNGGSVSIATKAASNGPTQNDGVFTDVTQSIVLSPGSVIDVSGGGYVGPTGKVKTGSDGLPVGAGGSVALTTYSGGFGGAIATSNGGGGNNAFNVTPHGTNPDGSVNLPNQANVLLDGTIFAEGFDGGGTLSLTVPNVVIDGGAGQVTSYVFTATAAKLAKQNAATGFAVSDANAGILVLPPSFFTSGFSQIALSDNGFGNVIVTAGTRVAPRQLNAVITRSASSMPTGSLVRSFAPVGMLPEGLRKPTSLTLTGNNVLVDRGAVIATDPQATVNLTTANLATILGSISAPAGTINVIDTSTTGGAVDIGASADLDVSGVFVPDPHAVRLASGTVFDAGTITVSGNTVLVQPGAQFDLQGASVSAASNLIQVSSTGVGAHVTGLAAWSNGGNLQLAGNSIYFAGSVDAHGGAPLAAGGSLTIGDEPPPSVLGNNGNNNLPMPSAIVIEQAGVVAANMPVAGASSPNAAFIGADTLSNSGFDSVTLNAGQTIAFNGSVNVTIPGALTLRADHGNFVLLPASRGLLPASISDPTKAGFGDPTKFVASSCGAGCIASIGGTTVNLNAGYVRISGLDSARLGKGTLANPVLADGTLNITAQWIDLERSIALDNVANANFTSAGAIRLLPANFGFVDITANVDGSFGGALVAPGNLTLRASEIYPVSNTAFLLMSTGTLASADTLMILPNGAATTPLSAGGGILLSAENVVQDGTLWAPLGGIVVGMQSTSQVPVPAAVSNVLSNVTFVPTQKVTVGAGSRTSVSAAGLDIPDGITVDDAAWYPGTPGDTSSVVMAAPPAKSISLFGANVATQAGAVLDLSGGGDIFATEFVAGTGGTRNVLATYQQDPKSGAYTPTFSDGRQVYALVPTYQASVAAYDPAFAGKPYFSGVTLPKGANSSTQGVFPNAIAPGQSVTIGAGSSIPAGTYTLLPGMYATLPGAYRVVQTANNINPNAARSSTGADGSQYVVGTTGNNLTGARSSQSAVFQIQSKAVWSKYTRIDITSGTSFFRNQALAANLAPPPLPIDGGVLTLGATNTLSLGATNLFAPGTSDLAPGLVGAGGQVQISGTNILILASDQAVPAADANFLVLDADQISALGASTVLIGATAQVVGGVEQVTATALNLEVKTDAAHALTGPELVLVSLAPTSPSASANGLTVDAGSVVSAVGAVPPGTDRDISIGADPVPVFKSDGSTIDHYTPGVSGDGALLRVSNGRIVNVTRHFVPGLYSPPATTPTATPPVSKVALGNFAIGAGVTLSGNALTLDTSGNGSLDSSANLNARNYDIAGSVINIGGNVSGGNSGIVLSAATLRNFAGADTVLLRSATVINFADGSGLTIGDPANPIGTLTFDSAGLYSAGGTTTVNAVNVVLADTQDSVNTGGIPTPASGGTFDVNASATFGLSDGNVVLRNFATMNVSAGRAITFTGAGSLDAGAANIVLSTPALVANAGASQSITTTGGLDMQPGTAAAPAAVASNIGGTLALTAGAIFDNTTIQALSGKLSLTATVGNLELGSSARVAAMGSRIQVLDIAEDAPAGSVLLASNNGEVKVDSGAVVDVSASGNGFAGSLSIFAKQAATLAGTLNGQAAFKDLGGNFTLQAGSLSSSLMAIPGITSFTGSVAVSLGSGDITIGAGQVLSSGRVTLVANSGSVIVDGTIDASGPMGGTIALYGAGTPVNGVTSGGVTIDSTAQLIARYAADDPSDPAYANGASTLVETGGTITLGTTGTPTPNSVNTTYGYENVSSANSGWIRVATGAVLDVSGGAGGLNINNAGGEIDLRAPLLSDNTVNVDFRGSVRSGVGGNGVVLNAYAVWATTDKSSGGLHFDGIVDPGGWFDDSGNPLAGKDQNGNAIVAPTPGAPLQSGQLFTPNTANPDHVNFYQSTLKNFVGKFAVAPPSVSGASFASIGHLRPEIDLTNPTPSSGSTSVNKGNITVASNWNLGAGSLDQNGNITLVYRTGGGEPGRLALLAANNVQINATITDGFFTNYNVGGVMSAAATYTQELNSSAYQTYLANFPLSNPNDPNSVNVLYNQSAIHGVTLTQGDTPTAAFFNMSQSAFNALKFALQAPNVPQTTTTSDPLASVIDQYNQYYAQYAVMFDAYARETNAIDKAGIVLGYNDFKNLNAALGGQGSVDPTTAAPNITIPSAPTLTTQYYDLTNGLGPITIKVLTQAVATTAKTDYADLWATYFWNVLNLISRDSTLPQTLRVRLKLPNVVPATALATALANGPGVDVANAVAAIALTPPAPPPTYTALQTGYSSSLRPVHPADQIADNPAVYANPIGGGAIFNTTSAAQLMTQATSGQGSFSYDIVAGAAFTVNPDAVVPQSSLSSAGAGSVTIAGHTSYADTLAPTGESLTIDIPTLVRTGTGSIIIAAAGNVSFTDQTTPGAVYTAGAAVPVGTLPGDLPADFTVPTLPAANSTNQNGLVSTPAWGTNGGGVSVMAGGSIIGIEMPVDDSKGSQTGIANHPTGQMWSDWYVHYGLSNGSATPFSGCTVACQTAAWVNYATFFQGFGALGGGNISLSAGANIVGVGASLPETLVVGGGVTGAPDQPRYYGGGDLRVTAGGDLLGSDFLVGRGTGLIQVGGAVRADSSTTIPVGNVATPLPLLLAVQDGFISVTANGPVTLGNVYDPASLPLDAAVQTKVADLPGGTPGAINNSIWNNLFTSFGPDSGVALTSVAGDVTALTLSSDNGNHGVVNTIFVHGIASNLGGVSGIGAGGGDNIGQLLPATLDLTALTGSIAVNPTGTQNTNLVPYPTTTGSDIGTINLVATGSINLGQGLSMPDLNTTTGQFIGSNNNGFNLDNYIDPRGVTQAQLTQALHANDPAPVVIAAGQDIIAANLTGGSVATTMTLIKPAKIEAGHNIVGGSAVGGGPATPSSGPALHSFAFVGQNNNPTDITSISAGNDFVGGSYLLYGPGTFVLQAGHDLGPFTPTASTPPGQPTAPTQGIATLGNGSALGGAFGSSLGLVPYLPRQGAELDLLFGVKPGIDYAGLIDQYLVPSAPSVGFDFLADIAGVLGISRDQAGATFAGIAAGSQKLTVHEQLAIDRAFLDFLTQVGKDSKNPNSSFAGQSARAYQAISALFPAALGYTDDSAGAGGSNGAATRISTGNFNIAASVLETQMGGDINILGPGGGVTVGHSSLDTLNPSQEGILTLAGGTIRIFTDASILLNQSRVMTLQGGDIDMFTANGDINAGSGPKTFVSSPAVSEICTTNGFCYTNPQGLVTGAGIGALVTLPGQNLANSSANLFAPHGTIDAGSAGIRVAGNLTINALVVLNAYNIQTQGTVTGLPTVQGPPVASLTTATNTAGSAVRTEAPAQTKEDQPSIIIVEFLGFGGGDATDTGGATQDNGGDANSRKRGNP